MDSKLLDLRLRLVGADERRHSTLEFSRFLYEINLSFEVSRLVVDREYADFQFPQCTFRPLTSRLNQPDQFSSTRSVKNRRGI